MRAGEGGAACGPYSLPGKVRMSIDSAISNRWSFAQSTIVAWSGALAGQVKQSPSRALLKVSKSLAETLGPALAAYPASRPASSAPAGSTMVTPAISSPPSAVNSSARRVDLACRVPNHVLRFEGSVGGSCCSGAGAISLDIWSIVTGVCDRVTSDAVVTLWACAFGGLERSD